MAEITKINIDGVVYDITGDTSYVENETLVISKGTSESSGTGGGETETIFAVTLTGVEYTGSKIIVPTQSVTLTEEQLGTLTNNKNVVIKTTLIENVVIMELKPFITEVEGINVKIWYGFIQFDIFSIGLKCFIDFDNNGVLRFEDIGLINEGIKGGLNIVTIDEFEGSYTNQNVSFEVEITQARFSEIMNADAVKVTYAFDTILYKEKEYGVYGISFERLSMTFEADQLTYYTMLASDNGGNYTLEFKKIIKTFS